MKFQIVFAAAVAASLVSPLAAQAQGIPDGVAHGAYVGNNTAGPIGAVVGGAVGGVIGGINGVLGIGPSYAAYPAEEPRAYRHRVQPFVSSRSPRAHDQLGDSRAGKWGPASQGKPMIETHRVPSRRNPAASGRVSV